MEPTTQAILVPISLWFILLIRYSSQIKKTTFENKSYFFDPFLQSAIFYSK